MTTDITWSIPEGKPWACHISHGGQSLLHDAPLDLVDSKTLSLVERVSLAAL
jgi:hypothetical protein